MVPAFQKMNWPFCMFKKCFFKTRLLPSLLICLLPQIAHAADVTGVAVVVVVMAPSAQYRDALSAVFHLFGRQSSARIW